MWVASDPSVGVSKFDQGLAKRSRKIKIIRLIYCIHEEIDRWIKLTTCWKIRACWESGYWLSINLDWWSRSRLGNLINLKFWVGIIDW